MRDPVTGFEYPAEWVERCTSPDLLPLAGQGLAILTASGTVLRRGFTTGTTAAAACKAALLSLSGTTLSSVAVHLPCGLTVDVPVDACAGTASCKKYPGDYPADVTAGLVFQAEAIPASRGIVFLPGRGIGRFSRDTPRYRKGEPAISPAPLACILASLEEAMSVSGLQGVRVTLHVPEGAGVGKKTLNPRVGVEGGISVLGTTGLVEPWDDHLGESVCGQVASACNPVITTGRIGLRYSRMLFPEREVILVGGNIRQALDAAQGDVVLCGLPALILRYINPGILEGTGYATIEEFMAAPGSVPVVRETLAEFARVQPGVRVVIVNRHGEVIGESP